MAYVAKEKDGGLVVIVMNSDEADALSEALRFCAVDGDLPRELGPLARELEVQ